MASRRLRLAVCAVVGVIAAASVLVVATRERARAPDVAGAAVRAPATASVPGGLLVWMEPDRATLRPNGDQSADGIVVVRMQDADGVAQTRELGPGIDARLWAGGSAPILAVERYDCSYHVFAYRSANAQWDELFSLSEEPLAVCADGSTIVHSEIGDGRALISRDEATGEELLRFTVPAMEGYSDDAFGGISMPIAYDSRIARATALVAGAGHVFAFSTNAQACQVTDFPSALTKTLTVGSSVLAACAGPDGRIYAATEGPGKGATVKIVGIDAADLATVSVADTGGTSSPAGGRPRLNRLQLLATDDGVVLWVVESTASPDMVAPTHLWLLADGKLAEQPPLPTRIGINAAYGATGSLLLYGGYAKSVVSRLDLSTARVSSVKEMLAPEGTWVVVAAD